MAWCTHCAWISFTDVHLCFSPLCTTVDLVVHVIQAAQYSHTNTHTKVVQLDYTYTHLWCVAHTVLGPCTFKLESTLYNFTLGSARDTSGTNVFESAQI